MAAYRSDGLYKASTAVVLINQSNTVYCSQSRQLTAGVYALVVWKCTFATLAYPSNAILLTNSAPSLLMLGTINGVAASTASLSRAFGPTVSGFLFSAGLGLGYSGLAWWCSAIIAVVGAIISLFVTDEGGRMDVD
ncbi:hypothetical protein BKA61DRAFT_703041 [Leptodontidium sp. MPI-SDFR-AT-0119]|nr:hypothetical protein BKA61DRAFT_703041 [Leptodontidium sp. MPI-SDFR-AT-0119]